MDNNQPLNHLSVPLPARSTGEAIARAVPPTTAKAAAVAPLLLAAPPVALGKAPTPLAQRSSPRLTAPQWSHQEMLRWTGKAPAPLAQHSSPQLAAPPAPLDRQEILRWMGKAPAHLAQRSSPRLGALPAPKGPQPLLLTAPPAPMGKAPSSHTLRLSRQNAGKRATEEMESPSKRLKANESGPPAMTSSQAVSLQQDVEQEPEVENLLNVLATVSMRKIVNSEFDPTTGLTTETTADGCQGIFRLQQGQRQGPAIKRKPNGDILEFNYENGKAHGRAIMTSSKGIIYTLTYQENVLQEEMQIRWPDGTIVDCAYQEGLLHGKAVEKKRNGNCFTFTYHKGKRQGPIITTFPDGTKDCYNIKDGKLHGFFQTTYANGIKLEINYNNGVPGEYKLYKEEGISIHLTLINNSVISRQGFLQIGNERCLIRCPPTENPPLKFFQNFLGFLSTR